MPNQNTQDVKRDYGDGGYEPMAAVIANLQGEVFFDLTVDPANLGANTSAETLVNLPAGYTAIGIAAGDFVTAMPPAALENGLVFKSARATATQIGITIYNPTAGAIDGASRVWTIMVILQSQKRPNVL